MPIAQHLIEEALKKAFPDSKFKLEDVAGDSDHYELYISLPESAGKTLIAKHQAIYKAISGHIGELPHALSINIIKES